MERADNVLCRGWFSPKSLDYKDGRFGDIKENSFGFLFSILFHVGNDYGNINEIVYVGMCFTHFQPCRLWCCPDKLLSAKDFPLKQWSPWDRTMNCEKELEISDYVSISCSLTKSNTYLLPGWVKLVFSIESQKLVMLGASVLCIGWPIT